MEPFLGQIQPFGFNFAPRGWAKCDGTLLPISGNEALFSLLGTIYGGDGQTTFALPDLRGRVSLHEGQGPGLTNRQIGQKAGEENVTLVVSQIPSHTHTLRARAEPANSNKPANHVLGAGETVYETGNADVDMGASAIQNTGGSGSHDNMQPFLVLNWCIALVGTFPSRN